jgi:hypothetical protein
MPMTFEEAEARFRQLQARVQRGEAISRAEYEEQVSMLSVTDDNGVLWEINPRTGKWMYFDGAEWVSGAPPGHDNSTVLPAFGTPGAPAMSTPPPAPAPQASASQPPASPEKPAYPPSPARRVAGKPPSAPPGGTPPQRPSMFAGREWVPLAIGAGVLLVCAVLLFFGGNFLLSTLGGKPATPTRVALPSPVSSPLPTQVRLPSPTPVPPTPVPVIGKITETQANVRNKPSTVGTTIITRLKKDTQITLIAVGPTDGANVWYQINIPDQPAPGWIRSDTFQIVSGDPKTLPPAGGTTPTATKPAAAQPTPTLTPIGVIPATPKP